MILEVLRDVASRSEHPDPSAVTATSRLIGGRAVVDSVALVELIQAVEKELERRYAVRVDLTADTHLSRQRSPFLSVSTLAEYLDEILPRPTG